MLVVEGIAGMVVSTILERGSPGRLLLDEKLPGKNEAEPDQLVKLHFFQKHFDISGETRFMFSFHPWG